jgi:hypothetical protein
VAAAEVVLEGVTEGDGGGGLAGGVEELGAEGVTGKPSASAAGLVAGFWAVSGAFCMALRPSVAFWERQEV